MDEARWPARHAERRRLEAVLAAHALAHPMPGASTPERRRALAAQIVASVRRQDYTRLLLARPVDPARADPHSPAFDPERAVVHHLRAGVDDEAAWLIFLMTHFGKARPDGWRRLADIYGMLGAGRLSWSAVSADPGALGAWLLAHGAAVGGRFGNHRKYESLRPTAAGTAAVVAGYVAWVGPSHRTHFAAAVRDAGNDPHLIFDRLYSGMEVPRFGRLARFDYLALVGRYGIAPIEPGSAYLVGATGPTRGARLLFDGRIDGRSPPGQLQAALDALAPALGVDMQVMEDSLCNWQKSPDRFRHFDG